MSHEQGPEEYHRGKWHDKAVRLCVCVGVRVCVHVSNQKSYLGRKNGTRSGLFRNRGLGV